MFMFKFDCIWENYHHHHLLIPLSVILHTVHHRSTSSRVPIYIYTHHSFRYEELDGRAVSALGVRSRKLRTGLNGQS
jgi:hypothetical protein